MKPIVLLVILAAALPIRETNSRASNQRGLQRFEAKQYDEAAKAFGDANARAPSSRTAFNLGTAQIAAGRRTQGSATLATAVKDPALRAAALFNRGNSALSSNAYEHAVRDYTEVLKLQPKDIAAKRNLEIALRKQEEQKRSGASGKQDQKGGEQNQQQQPSAGGQQQGQQPKGETDAEALLRSVQQQEQEERVRMNSGRIRERVGW